MDLEIELNQHEKNNIFVEIDLKICDINAYNFKGFTEIEYNQLVEYILFMQKSEELSKKIIDFSKLILLIEPNTTPCEMFNIIQSKFPEINHDILVFIHQQNIDLNVFGYAGKMPRLKFNLPNKSDYIEYFDKKKCVIECCVFTFDIETL